MSTAQIVGLIVGSVGGSGVLIVALGGWLGKIWAGRIAETERARHAQDLARLNSELDLARAQRIRLSEAQFDLYVQVWHDLQDLKTSGDRLWERASRENVVSFAEALQKAQLAANRGRLILPEDQYRQLKEVFSSFERYQIGKMRLIEIRSREELEENYDYGSADGILRQVRENRQRKEQYERLLDQIVDSFRLRLGLVA